MFVNVFTVTMSYKIAMIAMIAMKELSKEFGKNIPKSLPFDGGTLPIYFV
jgi:hypothetical protein